MLHHLYYRYTLEFNNQPRCEYLEIFLSKKKKKKETSWIP